MIVLKRSLDAVRLPDMLHGQRGGKNIDEARKEAKMLSPWLCLCDKTMEVAALWARAPLMKYNLCTLHHVANMLHPTSNTDDKWTERSINQDMTSSI